MTEKFLMARNFYRIFTENNPVMGDSKTFGIPEAKGLNKKIWMSESVKKKSEMQTHLIPVDRCAGHSDDCQWAI